MLTLNGVVRLKEFMLGCSADTEQILSKLSVSFSMSFHILPRMCSGQPWVYVARVRAVCPASLGPVIIRFYISLLIKHLWNSSWDLIGNEYSFPWWWLLWNAGWTTHYCTSINTKGTKREKDVSTIFFLRYGIRVLKLASELKKGLNFIF